MHPRLRLLLVLLLSVVMNGQPHELEKHMGEATVHLVGVDGFGHELGVLKVLSFKDEVYVHELRERFHQNMASKVPYGVYRLKVGHVGSWTTEKRVFVFKPDVWVILGLKLSVGDFEFPSPQWVVSGTVKNVDPAEEPVYVRLLGLYQDYSVEDRVDVLGRSGSFTLAGQNPQGRFLLVTLGHTHTLDVRELEIPAKTPIEIELSPPRGAVR